MDNRVAKSKICVSRSDLARTARPISGQNLGLTTAGSLKFGIETLSEARVGHSTSFRLVGEEGKLGSVDGNSRRLIAFTSDSSLACGWEKSGILEGEWVERTDSKGTGRLMVVSRTCASGVTSRNSYSRQEQWRPWGESRGVGPLRRRVRDKERRGWASGACWRYAGWSWLNGKASSIIRRH